MTDATTATAVEPTYPPASHALRDLPFEMVVVSDTHFRATLDLDRGLAPNGVTSVGAVATVVDVVAGSLCGRAVAPDWMATSALALHVGPLPTSGLLHVDAGVARLGRTTLVIQVSLRADDEDGSAPVLGDGLVSFSRLPRRDDNLDIRKYESPPGQRTSFALAGSGLVGTFEDAVGTVVEDAATGRTITPVVPYVQNSFGAVNGGIVAAVAARAARLAAGGAAGADRWRTTDLSVHYLSQVRQGAVRTRAELLRSDDGAATVRVELFDSQLEGQAVPPSSDDGAVASATVSPASWAPLMAVAHVGVTGPVFG